MNTDTSDNRVALIIDRYGTDGGSQGQLNAGLVDYRSRVSLIADRGFQ